MKITKDPKSGIYNHSSRIHRYVYSIHNSRVPSVSQNRYICVPKCLRNLAPIRSVVEEEGFSSQVSSCVHLSLSLSRYCDVAFWSKLFQQLINAEETLPLVDHVHLFDGRLRALNDALFLKQAKIYIDKLLKK